MTFFAQNETLLRFCSGPREDERSCVSITGMANCWLMEELFVKSCGLIAFSHFLPELLLNFTCSSRTYCFINVFSGIKVDALIKQS